MLTKNEKHAIRRMRELRDMVIMYPERFDIPSHALAMELSILTSDLSMPQPVHPQQTLGIPLCQLITRCLEEM